MELLSKICHPKLLELMPVGNIDELRLAYTGAGVVGNRWTTISMKVKGVVYHGMARCSLNDNFSRDTGRRLAFKRAARNYLDCMKLKKKGTTC